jgi:zinc transporter
MACDDPENGGDFMSESIIYAFIFDGQGGARAITREEIDLWKPEQGVLWVHVDYSHRDTRSWLSAFASRDDIASLDDLAVAALLAEETRPRAAAHNGGLLMALRGVNMNPNADPEDMVSVRLFADANHIISSRKRRLLSMDDVVGRFARGEGPRSSAEFVALLCDRLVSRMAGPIEEAEDSVDLLEESLLSTPRARLRNQLSDLRRQAISLRRYLAPQREALNWILSERVAWFDNDARATVRESGDRLAQYIETLDSVRERAAVTQEELVNQISEESNARMYVLSIVSAIFLPLGFATGLLGVNVGGIPGADNQQAFMLFVGMLIGVAVLMLVYFRYKRWL